MVEASMTPETRPDPAVAAAERALDGARVAAGEEYLAALKRLGLEPDALCWVYDPDSDETHLAIVTSMAERVGGLSIYKLLFRAYEAAATPREIDPFIVSVYGPRSDFGARLRKLLGGMAKRGLFSVPERTAAQVLFTDAEGSGRLVVLSRGVYAAEEGRRSAADDLRRFQRFERRVKALAA